MPHTVLGWTLVANPALLVIVIGKLFEGAAILHDIVRRVERLERLYIK